MDTAFVTKALARRFRSPHCCGYVSQGSVRVHCKFGHAILRRGGFAIVGQLNSSVVLLQQERLPVCLGPRFEHLALTTLRLSLAVSYPAAHVLRRNRRDSSSPCVLRKRPGQESVSGHKELASFAGVFDFRNIVARSHMKGDVSSFSDIPVIADIRNP